MSPFIFILFIPCAEQFFGLLSYLEVFICSLSGGHMVGNFPPHEAFPIGGTNSVRGYEEGAIGSGRSHVVGSGEMSFPLVGVLRLSHPQH